MMDRWMEKAKEVKILFSGFFAAATAVLGWFGWLVVIYAASMGIDYLTGSVLAAKNGDWKSRKAREGLWHKMGSILAVVVAALADLLLRVVIGNLPITLPFTYTVFLCPVVLVWYTLTELGSIVENVGGMGAPVPTFLKNIIATLHSSVEDAGDALTKEKKE